MATYVNDLRLKEIATGDEAGTWGTSTNTNLELIGEALGYGTQDCFASDADATTTVADGASDPARAMYFKVTSSATLTATRTLTIAPNTISRVMLIENATTGSQSITISQGSGSTVTIASGAVKMVYLDGAGAGGAVVEALADLELPTVTVADLTATTADINGGTIDGTVIGGTTPAAITGTAITATGIMTATGTSVFASLDISGDIDVDGTTNLDVVDIDGAVDMASTLTVGGVVTANAGVVVDNFTLDGTTLALSSGDLTLDVAGDIILDADDEGKVNFKDGGTQYARIDNNGGTGLDVVSTISDGDIRFRGNDGGSTIAALTLDMSASGRATFNNNVVVTDNNSLIAGSGDDLQIFYNGTNGEIDVSSGDLTLDIAGEIHLDSDSGIIRVRDAGGDFGMFQISSNDFIVRSMFSDADLLFKGNDGGSVITALTLDMSEAGAATFNSTIAATSADLRNTSSGAETTALSLRNFAAGANTATALNFYPTQSTTRFASIVAENIDGNNNITLSFLTSSGDTPSAALTLNQDRTATFSSSVTALQGIFTQTGGDFAAVFTTPFDYVAKFISTDSAAFIVLQDSNSTDNYNRIGAVGDSIQIESGNVENALFTSTASVFNENSVDMDFRVESDSNTHALFVDAGNSRVGIGESSPLVPLHLTTSSAGEVVRIQSDDAGGGQGPILGLYRNSSSPVDGDNLGVINFYGEDSAGNITTYAAIDSETYDVSNGTEDGRLTLRTAVAGSLTSRIYMNFDETVVNDLGANLDFRVESNNSASMLIVDGGDDVVLFDNTSFDAIDTGASSGVAIRRSGRIAMSTENGGNALEFFATGQAGKAGSISVSGTTTTYGTSSDQRLKENIADADDAGSKIDAIQVRKFDWKADGSHQDYGMVAQELQTVAPEAVSAPENPDEMMGVDYSKLVPMLIKEIQSLRARVADLES